LVYNKRENRLLTKLENILFVFMRLNLNIIYGILLFSVFKEKTIISKTLHIWEKIRPFQFSCTAALF
jgi:hypothetical protein